MPSDTTGERVTETTVQTRRGDWTVRVKGEWLHIVDEQGRERHRSRGHLLTGVFCAGLLSEQPYKSNELLDRVGRRRAESFLAEPGDRPRFPMTRLADLLSHGTVVIRGDDPDTVVSVRFSDANVAHEFYHVLEDDIPNECFVVPRRPAPPVGETPESEQGAVSSPPVEPAVGEALPEGYDLPTGPGVWWREGVAWIVRRELIQGKMFATSLDADGYQSKTWYHEHLPLGGWNMAAPADLQRRLEGAQEAIEAALRIQDLWIPAVSVGRTTIREILAGKVWRHVMDTGPLTVNGLRSLGFVDGFDTGHTQKLTWMPTEEFGADVWFHDGQIKDKPRMRLEVYGQNGFAKLAGDVLTFEQMRNLMAALGIDPPLYSVQKGEQA